MSYDNVLKHLQGQHDQSRHGKGGGGGGDIAKLDSLIKETGLKRSRLRGMADFATKGGRTGLMTHAQAVRYGPPNDIRQELIDNGYLGQSARGYSPTSKGKKVIQKLVEAFGQDSSGLIDVPGRTNTPYGE